MTREVVEDLFLAEEHRPVAGMGCAPNLNTEEAPVDLVTDVLRRDVALGEESEAESDPG